MFTVNYHKKTSFSLEYCTFTVISTPQPLATNFSYQEAKDSIIVGTLQNAHQQKEAKSNHQVLLLLTWLCGCSVSQGSCLCAVPRAHTRPSNILEQYSQGPCKVQVAITQHEFSPVGTYASGSNNLLRIPGDQQSIYHNLQQIDCSFGWTGIWDSTTGLAFNLSTKKCISKVKLDW